MPECGVPTKKESTELRSFRRRLLKWFRRNRRDLPWRRTKDSYRVWISEVMLQQTRVAAVIPYYRKFLARFSTVRALARADEVDVLKYWAGLGYYSRARLLHRAAKEIVARHAGRFPRETDAAMKLPGVGRYTAAAVRGRPLQKHFLNPKYIWMLFAVIMSFWVFRNTRFYPFPL